MEQEELKEILDKHRKWLYDEEGGERANLTGANLREANLRGANLTGANLTVANLREANLTGANLTVANLREANLTGANLTVADLREADLIVANLRGADLTGADLTGANLTGANLRGANLTGANLREANTDDLFVCLSCIGSRKDTTVYNATADIIWCGCFEGTLAEFETKCTDTHKDNIYGLEYQLAVKFLKEYREIHKLEEGETK